MRFDRVEIYSDKTGNAVMRHPERSFPGVLIQGDSLYAMCRMADEACGKARGVMEPEAFAELNALRNSLWSYLNHYKDVLGVHGIAAPFGETP